MDNPWMDRGEIAEKLGWTLSYKQEIQSKQNSLSTRVKNLLDQHGIQPCSRKGKAYHYDRAAVMKALEKDFPLMPLPAQSPPEPSIPAPEVPPVEPPALPDVLVLLAECLRDKDDQVLTEIRLLREENQQLRREVLQMAFALQATQAHLEGAQNSLMLAQTASKGATQKNEIEYSKDMPSDVNAATEEAKLAPERVTEIIQQRFPAHLSRKEPDTAQATVAQFKLPNIRAQDAHVYWETYVTPTELGTVLQPNLSAQQMNQLLEQHGLQKHVGQQWIPTVRGQKFSETFTVSNARGTFPQVRWKRIVLQEILPRTQTA